MLSSYQEIQTQQCTQSKAEGIKNLLQNCLHTKVGDNLVIVADDPALEYVDQSVITDISKHATAMGLNVTLFPAVIINEISDVPQDLIDAAEQADHVLFCAICGDQLRFTQELWSTPTVICYVLDGELLSKPFATTNHQAMVALKDCVDDWLGRAKEIVVTCPNGTELSGYDVMGPIAKTLDVSIDRFPMLVFRPILANGFSGKIALTKFVLGTGVRVYEPYSAHIDNTVMVMVENGRIEDFVGHNSECVEIVRNHYSAVAAKFDLDACKIHSWHAGIHPGCAYAMEADKNLFRWGNGAFGNPRILHFHTCADEAPGEIAINIFDPTISVDGIKAWENGVLYPERVPGGQELLQRYPDMRALFDNPEMEIGIKNTCNARIC